LGVTIGKQRARGSGGLRGRPSHRQQTPPHRIQIGDQGTPTTPTVTAWWSSHQVGTRVAATRRSGWIGVAALRTPSYANSRRPRGSVERTAISRVTATATMVGPAQNIQNATSAPIASTAALVSRQGGRRRFRDRLQARSRRSRAHPAHPRPRCSRAPCFCALMSAAMREITTATMAGLVQNTPFAALAPIAATVAPGSSLCRRRHLHLRRQLRQSRHPRHHLRHCHLYHRLRHHRPRALQSHRHRLPHHRHLPHRRPRHPPPRHLSHPSLSQQPSTLSYSLPRLKAKRSRMLPQRSGRRRALVKTQRCTSRRGRRSPQIYQLTVMRKTISPQYRAACVLSNLQAVL
jgi:hypothetical protein